MAQTVTRGMETTMSKILVATAVAIMIASPGAATAKTRHHNYRHVAPNAHAIGQPVRTDHPAT